MTLTPARNCTPMSCSQVARPFSKGLSAWRMRLTTLSSSTMRSRRLLRFVTDWRIYFVFELPDRNIITVGCQSFPLRGSVVPASETGSGVHDTSFLIIMMRDIDILQKCTPLSCFQVARPFFQGMVAPTWYGLENLSCLSLSFSTDEDFEGRGPFQNIFCVGD